MCKCTTVHRDQVNAAIRSLGLSKTGNVALCPCVSWRPIRFMIIISVSGEQGHTMPVLEGQGYLLCRH